MLQLRMPESRNERIYLLGTIALLCGLLVNVLLASTSRNDLDIFLAAARELLNGGDPYAVKYHEWYTYYYSIFFALLVSPLLPLGALGAKLVWGALTILMVFRCAKLLGVTGPRLAFFALLALFQPIRDNINASQMTVLVVWACIEALHQVAHGRRTWAAILIGAAIDVKLIPLVLLPYLIYRRQWRVALMAILVTATLTLAPALVLGWSHNLDLLASRWALVDPADPLHVLDVEEPSIISLGSLLSGYLSSAPGNDHALDLPRHFADLDISTLTALLWLGRLLLVMLALYFLRWPPFRAARSPEHAQWEVAYLLLCAVLIFPHQRNYSMFLAAPAVVWLATSSAKSGRASWAWWVLCALAYFGLNAELWAGGLAEIFAHYKMKSLIVLLLIGMLMVRRPVQTAPSLAESNQG